MGSFIEINDTLQLTTDQGFPADIFDYESHRQKPVTLEDVRNRVFTFRDKPSARAFQLDPVRVYFVHNIGGKWLFWGHVLIQTVTVEKALAGNGSWNGKDWKTSGSFVVSKVYDPDYQKFFTEREAPEDRNFFRP